MKYTILLLVTLIFLLSCTPKVSQNVQSNYNPAADTLRYAGETHLKNIRQLTWGGDNAEAYWSFDNKNLVFQATNPKWGVNCDQIYTMSADKGLTPGILPPLLSTGKGQTTCSYFLPGNKEIIYASTHDEISTCIETPRMIEGKYVWGIHPQFDIYVADLKGNIKKQLTNEPGYDAEATISPDGKKIVFTSTRSGDLELWTMNLDGSNLKQITFDLGYDGGAFFTPDNKQIIFRASRPKTPEDIAVYKNFLSKNLVQPTNMELYMCNADGSNLRQITNLGKANWAPFMHPSGKKIIFASNHHTTGGRQFNLFMINVDGTGLKQITFDGVFDSFPMFSYNRKYLVFASNRNNGGTRDTNIFIAEWVE
jgi:Tol biopolymer transport system component